MSILSGFLALATGTAGAADFQSFYQYSPSPQVIDGISYPRNGAVLYRGTDDNQMDLTRALRAMSGDKSIYIESKYFSTIKARLMGQSSNVAVSLASPVDRSIESTIAQNGRALDEASAALQARRIVDASFAYYSQSQGLVSRYLHYRSGEYIDWPSDIIFTTLVSPITGTYGGRTLVIREKSPRSIDLNYFNFVKDRNWYEYTRDAGEFAAHGYIPGDDLVGYQVRSGNGRFWHQIEFALYKKQNQILVFSGERESGRNSTCLGEDPSSGVIYHCDYREGSIVTSVPPLTRETPKLNGVLVICSNGTCPAMDTSDLSAYRSVESSVGKAAVQKALAELKSVGVELRFVRPGN